MDDHRLIPGNLRCHNCGNNLVAQFWFDHQSDLHVCCVCGACCDAFGPGFLAVAEERERRAQINVKNLSNFRLGISPLRKKSRYSCRGGGRERRGTYIRRAHIVEKLSQASMEEPALSDEYLKIIRDRYLLLLDAAWSAGGDAQDFFRTAPKREIIKQVLRSLDAKPAEGAEVPLDSEKRRNFWTVRCLEKWKTISCHLWGEEPKAFNWEDATRIGAVFDLFSQKWDEMNPPSITDPAERKLRWRFPERIHFPNFNATFVAIAAAMKIPISVNDFPIPTGPRCLKNTNVYLEALFTECRSSIGLTFTPLEALSADIFIPSESHASCMNLAALLLSDEWINVPPCSDLSATPEDPTASEAGSTE